MGLLQAEVVQVQAMEHLKHQQFLQLVLVIVLPVNQVKQDLVMVLQAEVEIRQVVAMELPLVALVLKVLHMMLQVEVEVLRVVAMELPLVAQAL